MKCSNCGKELAEYEKKCSECGTEVNTSNENSFDPINSNSNENKKSKSVLFVLLALIIILVVLAGYYITKSSSARYLFDKKVDEIFSNGNETSDYETLKFNTEFEVSVNSKESEAKEIADLINDSKFAFNTELNKTTQEEIVGLKWEKANDELINAEMKVEVDSKNLYINLGELFEKTIKLDISDLVDDEFEIAQTETLSLSQMVNAEKANKIFRKEIKEQLKDEYFSTEKVTIDDEKLTQNKLRMSEKEIYDVIKNVCNNLSENEEFLECYEDKEKVKGTFKEIIDSFDEADIEEDVYYEIDLYTKGIFKNIQRVDIVLEEDEEKITIQFNEKEDDIYTYKILEEEEVVAEGEANIEIDDDNFALDISVKADETEVKFKLSGNLVYDEEFSEFDTSSAVAIDKMTQDDYSELIQNFTNSKLYTLFTELLSTSGSFIDEDYSEEEDDFFEYDEDEEDNEKEEKDNVENTNKSSLKENQLKTYNDDIISFTVPTGYEPYSRNDSERYKLYSKEVNDERIDVDVSIEYDTLQEYLESCQKIADYYKDEEDYSNIKVSDVESVEVNGKTFKKVTVSYDWTMFDDEVVTKEKSYFAYEIDKDNLYTVEINNPSLISKEDLNTFLTIEKQ